MILKVNMCGRIIWKIISTSGSSNIAIMHAVLFKKLSEYENNIASKYITLTLLCKCWKLPCTVASIVENSPVFQSANIWIVRWMIPGVRVLCSVLPLDVKILQIPFSMGMSQPKLATLLSYPIPHPSYSPGVDKQLLQPLINTGCSGQGTSLLKFPQSEGILSPLKVMLTIYVAFRSNMGSNLAKTELSLWPG